MKCKKCGGEIVQEDYFCPHCGTKLKTPPLGTGAWTQAKAYLVSALLPPLGLWYAYRYYKNSDSKSRKIAIAVVAVNIVFLAVSIWTVGAVWNYLQREVERQLDSLLLF